jgi:CheY-like chemotaxis protein
VHPGRSTSALLESQQYEHTCEPADKHRVRFSRAEYSLVGSARLACGARECAGSLTVCLDCPAWEDPLNTWYEKCCSSAWRFGFDTGEEAMADGPKKENLSHTVLVAEDDSEVRDLLKLEFELEGFTVLTAANGAEAITTTDRLKPDVILMDLVMPIVDGIEATHRLLREKATKHIPVLMLTEVDNKEEIIRVLQTGAFDYIAKPFFLPEVKARVNAAIRYKCLHDELLLSRNQPVDNEKLQALREIFSGIQENIVSKLTVIMGKVDIIRGKEGNASKEDLSSILNAALKINKSITSFNILEFYPPSAIPNGQNVLDGNGLRWGGLPLQR